MSDIVLDNIASGYNLSKINSNFTKIKEAINNSMLHLTGDNNTMLQALDMNSYPILNLPYPSSVNEPIRLGDVDELIRESIDKYKEELLSLFEVEAQEFPPFDGSVLTLDNKAKNVRVEVNGRGLPPSEYSVSSDGFTVTLASEITTSDVVVVWYILVGEDEDEIVSGDIQLANYGFTSQGRPNDAEQLKLAIDLGNLTGKTVVGNRYMTIKLTGNEDIFLLTDLDLGGATLDISEWGGKFIINNSEWVVYEAGSLVFDSVFNTGVLTGDKIDGWATLPETNNAYVQLNSSAYHYTYRNIDITHKEFNASANRGKFRSLFLDFDTASLTSVNLLPLPDKQQKFGNFKLLVGNKTVGNGFLSIVDSAVVDFHDVRIKSVDEIFTQINPNFLDFFDSAFITINNVVFNKPFQADTPDRFAYGIRMEYCYDVRHDNLDGYGEGWGILGSNSSRLIYYKNCTLNRVDFHKPLVELLQLDNCKIGSWGMLLTTIGDVKIDNCTFINNSTDYFGQRAYIAANDSAGGFANGDLIITNSKFRSADKQLMLLYVNKANDTGGIRFPSPIKKQCWNRVVVDKCDFGYGYQTALMPGIEDDNGMRWPSEVIFRDCSGDCLISRNLVKSLPRYTITDDETDLVKPHNLFITIDNVETVYDAPLYIGDRRDQNFKIKVNLNNLKATNNPLNSGVTLSLVFGGDVSITNSLIEGFNFFETNVHQKPLNVMIDTSTINYIGRVYDEMFKSPAPKSAITATNCVFIGDITSVRGVARIKTVGCKMKINNSTTFYDAVSITDSTAITIPNGSDASKTVIANTNWSQPVELGLSIGAGSAYRVNLTLKDDGASYTIPIGDGNIVMTRNGSVVTMANSVGAGTNAYFYYLNKLL